MATRRTPMVTLPLGSSVTVVPSGGPRGKTRGWSRGGTAPYPAKLHMNSLSWGLPGHRRRYAEAMREPPDARRIWMLLVPLGLGTLLAIALVLFAGARRAAAADA